MYLNVKDFSDVAGLTKKIKHCQISTQFLQIVPAKDLKWKFSALLYPEMTHVFQWTEGNTAPTRLMEGIADYVKLKANYINPIDFPKPGQESKSMELQLIFLNIVRGLKGILWPNLTKRWEMLSNEHYFNLLIF